mgnify:CR=1 FL=1
MPKAILIMDDMPECCADCPCSFFERDNPILNLICGVEQEDAYNVGKPDWCPLRELPEKMEVCGKYPQPGKPIPSYRFGWNACLDEILKTDGMRKE